MKKIFLFLLKKYTTREEGRLEVFNVLQEQVCDEYREQTSFGNVYNAYIEFIMANNFIKSRLKDEDKPSLKMIDTGLKDSLDVALDYIRTEERRKKLEKLNKIK